MSKINYFCKSAALCMAIFPLGFLTPAIAADCKTMLGELIAYSQIGRVGNCEGSFNALYVKLASNRTDNHYVSYAEGWLPRKRLGACMPGKFPCYPSSVEGELVQQFSDRVSKVFPDANCPSGLVCPGYDQNFSASKMDVLGVKFQTNSTMILTLKSWGGAVQSVPLSCSGGMMYGIKDGTLWAASFKKGVFENECLK